MKSILLLALFSFSFSIGLNLQNISVYGFTFWCDENVVVCNGDVTDDQITGTDDNDIIYGWIGNDYLRGMPGDDIILGGEGSDTIIGDISNDVLNVTIHGKDILIGGPDDDILVGYHGTDELYGGTGDDWLRDFGPSNSNEINNFFGEEGNDLLVGSSSVDIFDCGDGIDLVLNLNLSQGDKKESNCEKTIQ